MPASVKNLKARAILRRITRRRLAALSAAAVFGGIALTSSPANAAVQPKDVYSQTCHTLDLNEVCISYDYTTLRVSANYYNGSTNIQILQLTLTYGSSYGQTQRDNLTGHSWFGFAVGSAKPPGTACASAYVNSSSTLAVCGTFN